MTSLRGRLLDLNEKGKTEELVKLLRSSTNEQISEALHQQLRQFKEGSIAVLVRIIFQNSTDSAGASRRLNVYKVAINLLQDQDITNRAASEIAGFLLMETDNLEASHLAELADVFTDAVKKKEPTNGKAFELLPKIISSLAAKETVSYGNNTMTGVEYKNHVLNTLSSSRWDPHCIIHLAAMFRDVSLTSDQLKLIMTKILRLCKDIDIQELPPLVYQLLLLATKGHRRLVLTGLTSFLTEQDKVCKAQHQEQNQNDEALSTISQEALCRMEGNVILHITFAIKQDQELGREFIKFLKASQLSDTAAVLSPFNVALALSIAQMHRFEEPIFKFLKSAILKSFKDAEREAASHWISEIAPGSVDVTESILDTVKLQNSSYRWDHVTQGLVQLGFTLMDGFGPRPGFIGKSTEHQPCTNTPNQRACSLGCQILVSTFKGHEMVRAEILDQLLNRIVTKGSAPVSHYIGLLANTVTSAPHILLDSLPKMQEAFDYLAFLPPSSAEGLLKAVQPLMKLNVSLKDSLLLVLRKAMFARQGDARKIAVSGYLQILKNFQVYGSLPESQISSQFDMSSTSQTMVDVHRGGNQQTNYEAVVCLEILGSLRRCFTQQADVRLILYEGLYEVLYNNSKLKDTIVDMLSKQWMDYYEADEDINPPIKLQRCVMVQGDQVYTSEPLSHLLQCICHCVMQCKKIMEQSNDEDDEDEGAEMHMREILQHLESVLASLTRRMIKSDLEDFELDKSADFSVTGSVGVKNNIFAILVLGMYEVLMEYNFTNTDYSAASAEQLLQLFSSYHKLSEVLRDKSNQKNKAGQKAARSLLSIKFVSKTLRLLFSDESPDRQECLIMLREESDFVRFFVNVALQKIQQLNDKGQCDGPAGNNMEKLYQFCCSVSRVFLHKFTADALSPEDTGRNERKKAVSSLCLEGLSTSVNVICSRFPERVAGYLRLIDPDLELEDNYTDTLEEEERVHLHIKKFQRLVMDMLTSDDGSSTKDAVHLCHIITLLAKQLGPHGAQFVQLQAWLSRVCAEQNIEDTGLAKVLLGLLFTLTQQFQSTGTLIRDVAQDIHSQIGDIDEDVEVEPSSNYSIVNAKTAAPTVLLLLMSQIDKFLEETEWVLMRVKADIGNESKEETEGNMSTQREDGEKVICNRLGMLVNAFHELVQSAIPVGPCVDATLKAVTRLFGAVALLCKYYLALYTQQAGQLSARFEKLIKLLATRLTQNVYSMINFIQTSQSERRNLAAARSGKAKEKRGEGEGSGTSGKAKGVMRETRPIPGLIFAIEQCEKFLIQLGKKSKVDLMEHIKLSTSRDFRINQQVLQGKASASSDEESSSDHESQPPSKLSKTDNSSGKAATKK